MAATWPFLPPGSSFPPPPGAVPGRIVRVGPRQYRATRSQRTRGGYGAAGARSPFGLLPGGCLRPDLLPVSPYAGWLTDAFLKSVRENIPGANWSQRVVSGVSERAAAATELERAAKQQPLTSIVGADGAATMSEPAETVSSAYLRVAWWLAVAVRLGAQPALLNPARTYLSKGSVALLPGTDQSKASARAVYASALSMVRATGFTNPTVIDALARGARGGGWAVAGIVVAGIAAVGIGVLALRPRRVVSSSGKG